MAEPYVGGEAQISYGYEDNIGLDSDAVYDGSGAFGTRIVSNIPLGIVPRYSIPTPDLTIHRWYNAGAGREVAVRKDGKWNMTQTIPVTLQNGGILSMGMGKLGDSGSDPYTHLLEPITATQALTLPSFTLESAYDGGTADDLVMWFQGTVLDHFELVGRQEGELIANLGIMSAKAIDGGTSKTSVTPLTTKPYMFDEGVFTVWGSAWARLNSFRFIYQNKGHMKWYFTTNGKFAYEYIPGNVVCKLRANVTIDSDDIWDVLLLGGRHGSEHNANIVFTRGDNDTLTITANDLYLENAPHDKPEEGEINVEMLFDVGDPSISVVDSIPAYPHAEA